MKNNNLIIRVFLPFFFAAGVGCPENCSWQDMPPVPTTHFAEILSPSQRDIWWDDEGLFLEAGAYATGESIAQDVEFSLQVIDPDGLLLPVTRRSSNDPASNYRDETRASYSYNAEYPETQGLYTAQIVYYEGFHPLRLTGSADQLCGDTDREKQINARELAGFFIGDVFAVDNISLSQGGVTGVGIYGIFDPEEIALVKMSYRYGGQTEWTEIPSQVEIAILTPFTPGIESLNIRANEATVYRTDVDYELLISGPIPYIGSAPEELAPFTSIGEDLYLSIPREAFQFTGECSGRQRHFIWPDALPSSMAQ